MTAPLRKVLTDKQRAARDKGKYGADMRHMNSISANIKKRSGGGTTRKGSLALKQVKQNQGWKRAKDPEINARWHKRARLKKNKYVPPVAEDTERMIAQFIKRNGVTQCPIGRAWGIKSLDEIVG